MLTAYWFGSPYSLVHGNVQRLRQFGRNTLLPERIARRAAFHRLVQKVFVDAHTRVSSFQTYHTSAQNSGQSHVNQDTSETPMTETDMDLSELLAK